MLIRLTLRLAMLIIISVVDAYINVRYYIRVLVVLALMLLLSSVIAAVRMGVASFSPQSRAFSGKLWYPRLSSVLPCRADWMLAEDRMWLVFVYTLLLTAVLIGTGECHCVFSLSIGT